MPVPKSYSPPLMIQSHPDAALICDMERPPPNTMPIRSTRLRGAETMRLLISRRLFRLDFLRLFLGDYAKGHIPGKLVVPDVVFEVPLLDFLKHS